MDTNFFINPQGNSNNPLNKNVKKATSYMSANNGLQKDTVSFSGKHIERGNGGGDWKKKLFALFGLTTVATPLLTGCNNGQATDTSPVETVPAQPDLGDVIVPEDYLAILPEIAEDYDSVQHLYLPQDLSFKSVTFAPTNLPKGVIQTIVSPEKDDEDNALVGSTLRALIDKATPIEAIAEANGIEDIDGAWHNAIHEYLQANPDLATHIATLNNVDDVEELTDDVIADTVLYNEGDKPLTLLGVVAPTFKMPVPGFGNEDKVDVVVLQTQYAPLTEDGVVKIDPKADGNTPGVYTSVNQAIVKEYDIIEGAKDPAFMIIAHQIANAPENKEIIETYIRNLNIATAVDEVTSPEDNRRTQALLAMENIDGLYLPDNIIINSIQHDTGDVEYKYTAGTTVYQLSARSPIGGESVHYTVLENEIDPDADPTANGITKLEDVLKYYFDPRTGAPLAEVVEGEDGKVFVQSNIKDQFGADLAANYMVNVIKDNLGIFAAVQTIDDDLSIFGAYDIKDADVVKFIEEQVAEAKTDKDVTDEEALIMARDAALEEFADGSIENFLQQYAVLNFDKAKLIEFYNEDGEIRFANEDGSPVKFELSDAYVTFGKASEVKASTPGTSGTPVKSGTPGTTSSTPGTTSSTPGTTSSTPGTTSSTPGTTSSTPGTTSSTPGTTSSTPGTTSSTPGTTSSTPGTTSSTPGTTSSTPGTTSSTPGTTSSTPGGNKSYTPPFNSDTPIKEPGDSKTPGGSTTPSGTTPSGTTPSGTTPSGTIPSDCIVPPPPSNSTTSSTNPNTVTGEKGQNATTPSGTTSSSTSSGGSTTSGTGTTSSSTSSGGTTSSGTQANDSSKGGTPGVSSVGQGTQSSTPAPTNSSTSNPSGSVDGGVKDTTSDAIKGSDDTDDRRGSRTASDATQTNTASSPQSVSAPSAEAQASSPQLSAPAPQSSVASPASTVVSEPKSEEPAAVEVKTADATAEAIKDAADVEVRGGAEPAAVEVKADGEIVIDE